MVILLAAVCFQPLIWHIMRFGELEGDLQPGVYTRY